MARLTRHQLKTDEFTARLESVSEFFLEHRKRMVVWGGAALLGIGIALGGFAYVRSQQAKAANAFSSALATYHAPVSQNPPANPSVTYFKTSEEKYQAASRQFSEVSRRFQRWQQGRWARYYAALCRRELGQLPEAEKELAAAAQDSDPELASLARMARAEIFERTSREAEAEKLYKELEGHPTVTVPKPTVAIALAELYQRTNPQQATAIYQRLAKDYPGTAAGDLAAKMLRVSAE